MNLKDQFTLSSWATKNKLTFTYPNVHFLQQRRKWLLSFSVDQHPDTHTHPPFPSPRRPYVGESFTRTPLLDGCLPL